MTPLAVVEAEVEEHGALAAVGGENLVDGNLRELFTGAQTLLKLHHACNKSGAVALHGGTEACYLHRILYGLEQRHGRNTLNGFRAESVEDCAGCLRGIHEHAGGGGQRVQEFKRGIVRLHGHADSCKVGIDFGGDFCLVDKQG